MTETQLVTFLGTAALKGAVIIAIAGVVNASWRSASASGRHLVWTIGIASAGDFIYSSSYVGPASSTRTLKNRVDSVIAALRRDWRRDAFYLWLAGFVSSLLPLVTSMARVRALEGRAKILRQSRWTTLIEQTPAIAHLARRVRVMESENTAMPMTWGIMSPTLLVPSSSERWPEWQCRNILLHELAHVERRDCLTQFVAQVACAVYWFNPLVWIAAHQMRIERELACDDHVISAGSRPSDYAANLLEVARTLRAPSFTSQSAIAMARPSQLSGRLLAVLDTNRNRRGVTRSLAAGFSLSALVVALPLALITPRAEAATVAESPSVQAAHELPSAPEVPGAGPARALPVVVAQDGACWAEGEGNTNISINDDDSRGRRPT